MRCDMGEKCPSQSYIFTELKSKIFDAISERRHETAPGDCQALYLKPKSVGRPTAKRFTPSLPHTIQCQ